MTTEAVIQEAIEEWAAIHSCSKPAPEPTLARYIDAKLAEKAPSRPGGDEVARFLVDAASFIDLARGTNFPDEFVRDMASCLRRGRDLLGRKGAGLNEQP